MQKDPGEVTYVKDAIFDKLSEAIDVSDGANGDALADGMLTKQGDDFVLVTATAGVYLISVKPGRFEVCDA